MPPRHGARERILIRVDVPAIRFISAVMLLCRSWAVWRCSSSREHLGYDRVARGWFGWSVALLAAVALISRGIFLGRPVTTGRARPPPAPCVRGWARTSCPSGCSATFWSPAAASR